MRLINRTLEQIESPIGATDHLLDLRPADLPLLDLSQGSPNYPTAPAVAARISAAARSEDGGRYTRGPGLDRLRELVASEFSDDYEGSVRPDQVFITAGCNQAFCVTISALADVGDEVIMTDPFYFNHDMWLRLDRLHPVYLPTAPTFLPDARRAEALITGRTRAIVLVSPGNPTGVTIPAETIADFARLARERDLVLILDETYRAFSGSSEVPHHVFRDQEWDRSFVSLRSFSKEFAIPGHRVGAIVGHPDLLREAGKAYDCVSICAPRLGQEAVITALTDGREWRAAKSREVGDRVGAFRRMMRSSPGGFELGSAGAFYGWVRHPFERESTANVTARLITEQAVVVLPGSAFTRSADRYLRFSLGNIGPAEIEQLGERLEQLGTKA